MVTICRYIHVPAWHNLKNPRVLAWRGVGTSSRGDGDSMCTALNLEAAIPETRSACG
jgi:hypothetical protein